MLEGAFKASLPGVLEDMEVPDGAGVLDLAGDGAKVLKILQRSFTESFIKIQHLEACQNSIYSSSLFLES